MVFISLKKCLICASILRSTHNYYYLWLLHISYFIFDSKFMCTNSYWILLVYIFFFNVIGSCQYYFMRATRSIKFFMKCYKLTSTYSAQISMLPTNSQTWLTFQLLISSLCDWHFRWPIVRHEPPLLRLLWCVGEPMLRFGLCASNFTRFVIGVLALRSNGEADIVACSLPDDWLLLGGLLGEMWDGCCWLKLEIENVCNGKRVLEGVVDVVVGIWLRLLGGVVLMFGRFVGPFNKFWISASLAALAKVTNAWVLLISMSGENTAGGNAIPDGNIEEIRLFCAGACFNWKEALQFVNNFVNSTLLHSSQTDWVVGCSLLQSGGDGDSLVCFAEFPNLDSNIEFLECDDLIQKNVRSWNSYNRNSKLNDLLIGIIVVVLSS